MTASFLSVSHMAAHMNTLFGVQTPISGLTVIRQMERVIAMHIGGLHTAPSGEGAGEPYPTNAKDGVPSDLQRSDKLRDEYNSFSS